ncbi:MAG: ribonuclease 3 [Nitrospinaceae bacterium]|nr:MAG: ribonuclease 3 [Nitrospinaceae bacterium]
MVAKERRQELEKLQKNLGYHFQEIKLLNKGLTHKSYVNETGENLKHNERFEFLGDSVLDLVVSDYMVRKYSDYKEGTLSKIRAAVVNETCLAELARKWDLGTFLLLGKGEEMSGGRNKASLLANAYEAVAGAIYYDSDLETAAKVLLPKIKIEIKKFAETRATKDYKSDLQEYTQNKLSCIPAYKVSKEIGPDHEKQFEVVVLVKDVKKGKGIGRSKKEAEQAAAKMALEKYNSK